MRCLLLAVATVMASACVPPGPVYSVRRSALVPHPAPPAKSGFPLGGKIRFAAHSSTVLVPVEPVEADGANAGLYVARHNLGAELAFRLGLAWDLRLSYQSSLMRSAMPVAANAAPPPDVRAATGLGLGLGYSARVSDRFRVGFDVALAWHAIPYFEEGKCIADCLVANDSYTEEGHHTVAIGSLSVLPGYRLNRNVVVFGGVTLRNHPTNTKIEQQTQWGNQYDDDDEIRSGPRYTLVSAGVEYAVGNGVKLIGQVFAPVEADIVRYGPAVGFTFAYEPPSPRPANRYRYRAAR
jgi:opacity protein-like surface antigen